MLLPRIVRPRRAVPLLPRVALPRRAEAGTPAPAAGADAYLTIRRAPLTFL